MTQRHVVVIGAGISGVLCAYTLAERGWDVTVLEAAHPGAGSSSRTAAGIRQQFSAPPTVTAMRYAVDWYAQLGLRLGEQILVQHGYLFLCDAGQRGDAERRVAMQRGLGLDVEWLEADEVVRRFPWVDASDLEGATFCGSDGFLRPQVVYGEGARLAREAGARFVSGARVSGAERVADRLVAVRTTAGTFGADLFIDCTNAWTARLEVALGATPLEVSPLKRYLWFLRGRDPAAAAMLERMPLIVTPGGIYCRPENRDTLLMGRKHATQAEWDFSYEDQDLVAGPFSHKSGPDAVPYEVWAELAATLPKVGEFEGIVATTSGYYGSTPDHHPFLDFDPLLHNLIRLVGFSGHGAMFGPFTARVALHFAELGEPSDRLSLPQGGVDLRAFKIGRPMDRAEALVI